MNGYNKRTTEKLNKKSQETQRRRDRQVERTEWDKKERQRLIDLGIIGGGEKKIFDGPVTYGHAEKSPDPVTQERRHELHRMAPVRRSQFLEGFANHDSKIDRHERQRLRKRRQRPFTGDATKENLNKYYQQEG